MNEGKNTWNEWQAQAIQTADGPVMVLAGPGSGKTRVITHRIAWLQSHRGVRPENILVITFTRAAAQEMKERYEKLSGRNGGSVVFGTFHSVYFQILRLAYHYDGSNILKEDEKRNIIQTIIGDMDLNTECDTEFITDVVNEIGIVKGNDVPIEKYESVRMRKDDFVRLYRLYEKAIREEHKIDFDDMLLMCRDLLRERSDIRRAWQERFQYVMVDEMQDINQVQYDVLRMLAEPENNLFVVGDDDQSIYGFRGAKPELMFQFMKDYPKAKQLLLPINYRSTSAIVERSLRLIRSNRARFDKKLQTDRGEGAPVRIYAYETVWEEAKGIIERIRSFHEQGVAYGEMAVLFRTNAAAGFFTEQMVQQNIPFYFREQTNGLYRHWLSQVVFSYLRLANDCGSREDLVRVVNCPLRYISRDKLGSFETYREDLYKAYRDKPRMLKTLDEFFYHLSIIKQLSPKRAVIYMRREVGLDRYVKTYAAEKNRNVEEWYDVLDKLEESAQVHASFAGWMESLEDYEQRVKQQALNRNRTPDEEHVNILTMHGAKGLEYTVVFLPQVNEGQIPHPRAVTGELIEEERRIFYVAMTRAKDFLFLSYVRERYDKECEPSRFLEEMENDADWLRVGAACIHRTYGAGTIKRLSEGRVEVYFPSQKKTILFNRQFVMKNRLLQEQSE